MHKYIIINLLAVAQIKILSFTIKKGKEYCILKTESTETRNFYSSY